MEMYRHEEVGTNSRLDALQAAVLRVKLRHLDSWSARRRGNAHRYQGLMGDIDEITLPVALDGYHHVYNQFTIRARDRDDLRAHLAAEGIASGLYYPTPLHLQECFRALGGREGDLPVAEALCADVLSLPIFPELGEERLDRVAGAIRSFYA
jgi:dTDP-4-amino-4,6-dideoxygalactose transaminase